MITTPDDPTTPDPTAAELLADANLILENVIVINPRNNLLSVALSRRRYQQWLTQQTHPATQTDGDPDGYLKARGAIRGGEPAEVTIRRTRGGAA